jgi:hypothetical protein
VHHAPKDIEISAGRDWFEEASGQQLAAIKNACPQKKVRPFDNLRLIEEHAARTGVRLKNLGQEAASPSANIDDTTILRKVVGARDQGTLRVSGVCHPAIEALLGVRMCAQVIEEIHAVHVSESGLTGLDVM